MGMSRFDRDRVDLLCRLNVPTRSSSASCSANFSLLDSIYREVGATGDNWSGRRAFMLDTDLCGDFGELGDFVGGGDLAKGSVSVSEEVANIVGTFMVLVYCIAGLLLRWLLRLEMDAGRKKERIACMICDARRLQARTICQILQQLW